MSARKRAAGTAASPDLDTQDPVKKRKKNDVSNLVAVVWLAVLDTGSCGDLLSACIIVREAQKCHECSTQVDG
jgi:hypothetical protein